MKPINQQQLRGMLFTDQYQLTMSQLYYRAGLHETTVQFDHFFRRNPDYGSHQAGYCVNAGLEWLLDWMQQAHVSDNDIELLRSQRNSGGGQVFADDFLTWLRQNGDFSSITLRAVPEGRVVHPHTPLTVIQGPLVMCQLLETSLLNHLNYQILIATKAARIADSGRGRPILEFGLRRAQGRGANAGSRAALIGGADFTSNVGLSHAMGLPPKGTHAHSMIQLYMALGMGELEAFRAYAKLYPDDCLLLVDTIDTLQSGVPHAIQVFDELTRKGHKPVGVRLDSGDLAYLSIQVARLLNEAGYEDTAIVLSSDLDELVVWQITTQIAQEAPRYDMDPDHLIGRLIYGVGTRLITSWGEPALGGVYKLVAAQQEGTWRSAVKISETPAKTPNPGQKELWRLYDRRGTAHADLLCLEDEDLTDGTPLTLHHPSQHNKYRTIQSDDLSQIEPLLVDVLDQGKLVYDLPDLEAIRQQRRDDIARLNPGVCRLVNPHIYHVSLTEKLWKLKEGLIESARQDL